MSRLSDDETVETSPKTKSKISVESWGGHSEIGLVRKQNEDAWGERGRRAFVVADGMGGTSGGALASSLAVAGFLAANPNDAWLTAMRDLNQAVRKTCRAEGFASAGTTLVGAFVGEERCVIISIGDSRIYRHREGELENLTIDHNLGNLRRAEGYAVDHDDGRGRPAALTAFLGSSDDDQPIDVRTISVRSGDRLLLCSDGVHGQIAHTELADALASNAACDDAAAALTAMSLQAGGRDNATALVVDLEVAT